MRAHPFDLTATDIERLANDDFVALVNRLIRVDCHRLGLPPDAARTTLRINDADGGVDALTDAGESGSRFVPPGWTAWQYKQRWEPAKLQKEIRDGPAVQEAFRQGAGYTLVVARGMTPAAQVDAAQRLRRMVQAAGGTGPVRLSLDRWRRSRRSLGC